MELITVFIKLLLLFAIIPIIELTILIKIGSYIGVLYTILLVGLTGLVGITLARSQGFKTINRVKYKLEKGVIPTDDMIGGLLILIGGIMLLTPGLITDITGFCLILPGTRHITSKFVKVKFKNYVRNNHIKYRNFNFYSENNVNNEEDYVDIDIDDEDK